MREIFKPWKCFLFPWSTQTQVTAVYANVYWTHIFSVSLPNADKFISMNVDHNISHSISCSLYLSSIRIVSGRNNLSLAWWEDKAHPERAWSGLVHHSEGASWGSSGIWELAQLLHSGCVHYGEEDPEMGPDEMSILSTNEILRIPQNILEVGRERDTWTTELEARVET